MCVCVCADIIYMYVAAAAVTKRKGQWLHSSFFPFFSFLFCNLYVKRNITYIIKKKKEIYM